MVENQQFQIIFVPFLLKFIYDYLVRSIMEWLIILVFDTQV